MVNRPWLEELRGEFSKRRLPPACVERLVAEVSDHWDDLTEESMSTETDREVRLGPPQLVAEAAVCAYRRGGLLGRPLLSCAIFVLLPLPVVVALWLGLLCAAAGVLEWLSPDKGQHSFAGALNSSVVDGCIEVIVVLSTAGLAGLFGRLAQRTGSGGRWGLTSGLILALVAGLTVHQVKLSDVPGQSLILLGLGVGAHVFWQCVQFALALALCLLALRWQTGRGRLAQSA
jgi:hypothetical protein